MCSSAGAYAWMDLPGIRECFKIGILVGKFRSRRSDTPNLYLFEDDEKSFEMCLKAVQHDASQYKHVPEKFKTHIDIVTAVIKSDCPSAIRELTRSYRSIKTYKQLIDIEPSIVFYLNYDLPKEPKRYTYDSETKMMRELPHLETRNFWSVREELFYYALSKDVSILNIDSIESRKPVDETLYRAIIKHENWRDVLNTEMLLKVKEYEVKKAQALNNV